ncbi:membrane protein [Pseudorhizobium endolithicum]|uniref:Membrane protein n=2 Tax=Pseudorhizobium endolithicum TaxID=1191678 RepID=A0ABN7JWX8_9HYPH|nr:membrane protein [Pseudorhizobium endolithicum]
MDRIVPHTRKTKRFGIDPASGKLALGGWHLPMPRSRAGRMAVGGVLIVGGTLGFLPVLGFWMVPLGLIVLSHDLPSVRRKRRRLAVWWERRRQER